MTKYRVSSVPTRDGRNDADGVAGRDRGLLFLQVANVLVIQIHIDEASQLALLVVEMRLETRMLPRQVREQLADGCTVGFHRLLLIRVRPERCRNQNSGRRHSACPHQNWTDLLSGTTRSCRAPRPP